MVADLCMWGANGRYDFALVPAIDSEIVFFYLTTACRDKVRSADQAQVSQVGLTIFIA